MLETQEEILPVDESYRIAVYGTPVRRRSSVIDIRTYYPEYYSHSEQQWRWQYDNAWLVAFWDFYTDLSPRAEQLAREDCWQSMRNVLVELALQRFLQPGWQSYQDIHGIAHSCPPDVPDAEQAIAEYLGLLQSGQYEHRWFFSFHRIERAIVAKGSPNPPDRDAWWKQAQSYMRK